MELDLDHLLTLAAKATPGPWRSAGRHIVPVIHGARHMMPLGVTYGSDEVMTANAAFIAAANPAVVAELVCRLQTAEGLNELTLQTLNPVQPGGLVLVTLGDRHRAWRDEVVIRAQETIKAAFPGQPVLCVADWVHIEQLSKTQLRELGLAVVATVDAHEHHADPAEPCWRGIDWPADPAPQGGKA